VRATYIGLPLSDTISQAAPTPCINVPISETTSAMSKLRKIDDLRGRQRLAESGLDLGAMPHTCASTLSASSRGAKVRAPLSFSPASVHVVITREV
jgi:hypothetical protein